MLQETGNAPSVIFFTIKNAENDFYFTFKPTVTQNVVTYSVWVFDKVFFAGRPSECSSVSVRHGQLNPQICKRENSVSDPDPRWVASNIFFTYVSII